MSLRGKKWVIKDGDIDKTILQRIFENQKSLNDNDLTELHDPYKFRDMGKAVARIKKAIDEDERIIIFGDYDVDGITGTAILYQVLRKLHKNVSCRIPNRVEDGYGLSEKFIEEFREKDIKLLITVDCGISSKAAVDIANSYGIDTIITDHHTIPKDMPKAFAILHPKEENSNYPYSELTGAGVALKLAQALSNESIEPLLDLAALGTVADLGPLDGENRFIVQHGLRVLADTKWIGLKRIMELAGVKDSDPIDTYTIGYRIAPRINAAGRIESPYTALSLLLQDERNEKVETLGARLEEINSQRQEMTSIAVDQAEREILQDEKMPYILIAHNNDWHVGIVGLIAGRLAEKYARPAIILQDFGDTLVASARSPEYFDIIDAITHCKEHLDGFGGHRAAAGFSIKKEKLEDFKKMISEYAEEKLKNVDLMPILEIDYKVIEKDLDLNLFSKINELSPFGVRNMRPVLLLKKVEPYYVETVGKDKKHLKFTLKLGDGSIRVIAFNMGEHAEKIKEEPNIDIVFHLDKNLWNNKEYLQIQVLDISLNEK